jgi:hypothetical protein
MKQETPRQCRPSGISALPRRPPLSPGQGGLRDRALARRRPPLRLALDGIGIRNSHVRKLCREEANPLSTLLRFVKLLG